MLRNINWKTFGFRFGKFPAIVLSLFFSLAHTSVMSSAPQLLSNHFSPHQIGQGRLQVFIFDVYDIRLFAEKKDWDETIKSALVVDYKMALSKDRLIETTVDALKQARSYDAQALRKVQGYLNRIYLDLEYQDQLVAVFEPLLGLTMYHNGRVVSVIEDPQFALEFMKIWLGDKTPEPALRRDLLGLSG